MAALGGDDACKVSGSIDAQQYWPNTVGASHGAFVLETNRGRVL